MSRAFQNGMTLAYWSKNELSRAPRSFESDLIKFSGKVWASRTASFRGQEIFPMMSGDAPRHTKVVSSKKMQFFFWDFNFGWTFQRLLLMAMKMRTGLQNGPQWLPIISVNSFSLLIVLVAVVAVLDLIKPMQSNKGMLHYRGRCLSLERKHHFRS